MVAADGFVFTGFPDINVSEEHLTAYFNICTQFNIYCQLCSHDCAANLSTLTTPQFIINVTKLSLMRFCCSLHGISHEHKLQITMSFTRINYALCQCTHTYTHTSDRTLTLFSGLTDSCWSVTFQSLSLKLFNLYSSSRSVNSHFIIPDLLVTDL